MSGLAAGQDARVVAAKEQDFFDEFWQATPLRRITTPLELPGIDLRGRRVLICSCGSGAEPVRAANAGASEVHAFDISTTAVAKALAVARFNGVRITAQVMDFHELAYADGYFDVIYGSAILHHVDCGRVAGELYRCLRPGGVAYFCENSDRNPLLRRVRRALFGSPGEVQRSRALGFRRHGTSDEYPLTDDELRQLAVTFDGELRIRVPHFMFFELLAIHGWRHARVLRLLQAFDRGVARALPAVARYSFLQDVMLVRRGARPPIWPADAWPLARAE
jgi:SAM-dependent methyltransferase